MVNMDVMRKMFLLYDRDMKKLLLGHGVMYSYVMANMDVMRPVLLLLCCCMVVNMDVMMAVLLLHDRDMNMLLMVYGYM